MSQDFGSLDLRSGISLRSSQHFGSPVLKNDNLLYLFADGKQGVWYDPSDKSTLFQDVAGTVPVTKDGDPVGLMRDKSGNGNHATQSVSTSRPIYKTDDTLHWLEFDGVDDELRFEWNPDDNSMSNIIRFKESLGIINRSLINLSENFSTAGGLKWLLYRPVGGLSYITTPRLVALPFSFSGGIDIKQIVAVFNYDTGTVTAHKNGLVVSAEVGKFDIKSLSKGTVGGGAAAWAGNIYRVLVVDRTLSTQEVEVLQ